MFELCCIPPIPPLCVADCRVLKAGWESQEKGTGKLLNISGNGGQISERHKEPARATKISKVHACRYFFFF